jgi:ABC-type nitrate/sulfonate/bicarbonate transport system substrate-binding protein
MTPNAAHLRDDQVHWSAAPERAKRRHWSILVIGVAALAAAACSSSGGSSAASPGGSSAPAQVENLTLAIPAALVNFGDAYIATEQGYFKQAGLNVNVVDPGTTGTVALLQSGHADLAETATGLVIPAVQQGLGITVVAANGSGGGDYLVGGPKVKTVAQLQALQNCVIGTQPVGSAAYAWALQFKDKLNLTNCSISQLATVPVLVSATLSGQVSVAVVVNGNVASLQAGGGNVLVDPTKPGFAKQFQVAPAPGAVTYGLTSHLKSIQPEIERYLKAEQMAHNAMATFSVPVEKLAAELQKEPGFTAVSADTLVAQLNFAKATFATTFGGPIGYIDQAGWNAELQQLKNYGIAGYDPSAAIYSYSKMVDMSYLNAALQS